MANVSFKKVEKIYPNGFKALHGIDLDIADGEFIALVGPSGCAKSTLLRMVAGLEPISSGQIAIGNLVVNNIEPKARGIAMVFQNYALYPHMKVYDNLAFGLSLAKTPKDEIASRVAQVAKTLEIGSLLDRLPRQLSGGQAQRVAVGRAIVKHPEVFLFDEPLSNLDAKLRASMRVRITELHKDLREKGEPSTVIYVTHDQVEAMTMGERICVMKEGLIMQVDRPTTLYHAPANAFVASFIGSPEMNIHEARLVQQEGALCVHLGDQFLPLPQNKAEKVAAYAGKNVQFGIRPEHIGSHEVPIDEPALLAPIFGKMRIIEHMGHEVFVHFDMAHLPCTARMEASRLHEILTKKRGEMHLFSIRMSQCHLFDTDTGINISL